MAHQDKENDIEAAGRHRRQSHSLKKVQGNLSNIKDERITNMSRQIRTSAKAVSSGNFIATKGELLECVQGEDKTVLELSISLQNCIDYDFDKSFSVLFNWCQNALSRI